MYNLIRVVPNRTRRGANVLILREVLLAAAFLVVILGNGKYPAPDLAAAPAAQWSTPSDVVFIAYDGGSSHSSDDLIPYLTYVDREGNPTAPFFDGFILTPTVQTFTEWEDNLFRSGIMLSALEEAAARVAKLLPGSSRIRVYVTIPNPEGKTGEERAHNARRFIDNIRLRFAEIGYEHIQLAGFYWHQEGLRDPASYQAAKLTAAYLHSLVGSPPLEQRRLQLLWVPYDFGHPNRLQVREWAQGKLPIDAVWLQPNFLWAERSGYDTQDLDETARFALSQGISVEVEFDAGVFSSGWKAARYHHYLVSGVTYGYMVLPLTYYEGGGALLTTARSTIPSVRQLYEETYAFSQNQYVPRALLLGGRWMGPGSEEFQALRGQQSRPDSLLPFGLWLGRTDRPEAAESLRLVEPDPNQSYWLILTFRAPASVEGEGVVTITTRDGATVELGRYPLDGRLHTRWYTIPGSVLRRGVSPVPASGLAARLVYPIRFSTQVELYASWARADQWIFRWDAQAARFWAMVDPEALVAQEGRTLPGVRFDAAANEVQWAGMDDSQPLLVGIQTDGGWTRLYTLSPAMTDSHGQGSFVPEDLPAGSTVVSVFAQPANLPFHTVFGAEGDTAAGWRNPGVALLPEASWLFVGKPVGVSRRLAGQGRISISVPAAGIPYRLHITFAPVVGSVQWSLQSTSTPTGSAASTAAESGVLASGTFNPGDSELSLVLPGAGQYELVMEGGDIRVQEAWLITGGNSADGAVL